MKTTMQSRPHIRGQRPHRRGSAMILVISVIVVLLLIGLSLVTITERQQYAANATA